jgi:hypothetical protein
MKRCLPYFAYSLNCGLKKKLTTYFFSDEVLKESIEASGRTPCDQHHLGDMAVLKKVHQ